MLQIFEGQISKKNAWVWLNVLSKLLNIFIIIIIIHTFSTHWIDLEYLFSKENFSVQENNIILFQALIEVKSQQLYSKQI